MENTFGLSRFIVFFYSLLACVFVWMYLFDLGGEIKACANL